MNKRERILAGTIFIVIVLGGYGLLRFEPTLNDIKKLRQQKEATLIRLANMDIPAEPQEEIDDINRALDDQELALAAIRESAERIESQLAPIDSQELKVRISQLAKEIGLHISVTEIFRPTTLNKNQSKDNQNDNSLSSSEAIPPVTAGWITRFSPGSMVHRPLQKMVFTSNYHQLRTFIHGLDSLPYKVTVVRMNIDKPEVSPLQGMLQVLKTELVLAL